MGLVGDRRCGELLAYAMLRAAMPLRKNLAAPDIGQPLARRRVSDCPFLLTEAEKRFLEDPDWIDEEEADLILAMREEQEHDLSDCIPLREHIREHGFEVQEPDSHSGKRQVVPRNSGARRELRPR